MFWIFVWHLPHRLRLRLKFESTLNAVPFAGQSDIKKLRRENYHLRKEIWTLRDEHDRLGKLLRSRNREGGGSSSYVGAGDSDADEKIAIDDYVDDYDYEYDDDYRCCSCHSNEVLLSIRSNQKQSERNFIQFTLFKCLRRTKFPVIFVTMATMTRSVAAQTAQTN